MAGKPASDRARLEAARMVARGERPSVIARTVNVSPRTLRRWRQDDPAFERLVARARTEQESTAHSNAKRRARRMGLPAPTSPAQARKVAAEMERAAAELQARAQERITRAAQPTDDVIREWIARQAPRDRAEWLEQRDCAAGVGPTPFGRRWFDGGRSATPSFRVVGLPTNASLMYEQQRLPDYVHDPFAGSYAKATDDGSSRVFSTLTETWRTA